MVHYDCCRTPEEFDRGYANRITPDVVARWEAIFRERSRELLASPAPRREFAYGPHPRQRIDFFPAPGAAPDAPVLVAIHGGLWFLFDRWMMHALVAAFTGAGVHVACPGYRLAPEHSLATIVEDCRLAVRTVRAESAGLGFDPDRLAVLGHSAAGQLAAVVAGAERAHRCVGVSGFYDIEPFGLTDFQPLVRFTPEDYADHNPMRLVRPGLPPTLLVTGAKESGLIHEMTEHYAARLAASKVRARALDVPGTCHFSVLAALGDPASVPHRETLAWINGVPAPRTSRAGR